MGRIHEQLFKMRSRARLQSGKQRYVVNGVFYMTCSEISPTTRSHIISRPFIPLGTPLTTSPTCQDWLFVIKFGGNSRVVKMVASPLTRLAETGFAWKVRLPRELRAVSTHEGETYLQVDFHFRGADLELPGKKFMVADSITSVLCLAMGSSNGMSVFGNAQHLNYNGMIVLRKRCHVFPLNVENCRF
ncbi:predicted protein [Arabidopsis lyrata subsp. lyrata]|uniref:Predicted protein n=1 Tax=Arabidopsis lyrata subsp. lyrata TaxID=81972 RepID=D7KEW0_ARALL|nr:predicted protein [Arabidopsis lyrata subsp. lyrata]